MIRRSAPGSFHQFLQRQHKRLAPHQRLHRVELKQGRVIVTVPGIRRRACQEQAGPPTSRQGLNRSRPRRICVKIGRRALANGLLCRFDPHWIAFGPALVVTAEQLDEMLGLLDRSMGEVLNASGRNGA